jgi:hypothetical protein
MDEVKKLLPIFFLERFLDKFYEYGFLHPRFIGMMSEKDVEKFKRLTKMKFAQQVALVKLVEYCAKKFPCKGDITF